MTVIKHLRGKISHFLSEEPKKIMNDSKEREISQGASCNQHWNEHTLLGQENVIDSGAVACGVVGALCFLDDHSQNISAQILGDSRFLLLVKWNYLRDFL